MPELIKPDCFYKITLTCIFADVSYTQNTHLSTSYLAIPNALIPMFHWCAYNKRFEKAGDMVVIGNSSYRSGSCVPEFENPPANWWAEERSVHAAGPSPGVPADWCRGGGWHPPLCHFSFRMPSLGERPDTAVQEQAPQSPQRLNEERIWKWAVQCWFLLTVFLGFFYTRNMK